MTEQSSLEGKTPRRDTTAVRVRLPGFIANDEIGLGDTIKRVTYAFGLKPCGGCEQRATALNRWVVFTR
jgi:hypothetical protein